MNIIFSLYVVVVDQDLNQDITINYLLFSSHKKVYYPYDFFSMVPLPHIIGWTALVINGKYSGSCISHDFTQISQFPLLNIIHVTQIISLSAKQGQLSEILDRY